MRVRKKLPHDLPIHIVPEENLFFITLCSLNRNSGELLAENRPQAILDAVKHRHHSGIWYARVFVVMPDHVHGIFRFPNSDFPMRKAVNDFKRWTARAGNLHWQDDFFDHRLRQDESVIEKSDYILMNPVRAGLVESTDNWPHYFIAPDALG